MADATLTLLPEEHHASAQKRPSAATLADALAQSPDALLALVRELPVASRERTIATALGRAIAETVRVEAVPFVREWLADAVPRRVAAALDEACRRYSWGYLGQKTLPDEVREMLRAEVQRHVTARAAALTRELLDRVRVEVAPDEHPTEES